MASGKEIQLYSDIGKSQPVYPKTNAKCVFYDDGTRLDRMIAAARPRNLLINSDFTNPVNRKGQTSYTASGYTIDRWIANKAQPVTVNSDGITLDGTSGSIVLAQRLNTLKDGIYTVAVKVGEHIQVRQYKKEGTTYTRVYTHSDYPGGYVQLLSNNGVSEFQFRANSGSIITAEWAALYEGEYTADTLPEYQPKGYEQELLICNQYDPSTGEYIGLRKFGQPHNLLDNSDFTNPVNQGGQTSYAGAYGYCIDRWTRSVNGTVTLTNKGVEVVASSAGNAMLSQDIAATPNMVGKKFTLAYCNGDGVIGCGTFAVNTVTTSQNTQVCENVTSDGKAIGYVYLLPNSIFRIQLLVYKSNSTIFRWAALYEGEYNIDTLPGYVSKGKQVEALSCGAIPGPIDLLWGNASPASEFAAQTVAVDLSLYNWVLVEANYSTEYSERATMLVPIADGTKYSIVTNRSGSTIVRRFFTTSKTGIAFENGASGSSNGAKYMIPVKIYGVKG